MIYEIIIILKAQLVVISVVISSYIIESMTTFKLFISFFKLKKNKKMANASADLDTIIYFLICLGTLLYDQYFSGSNAENYDFWLWFILMVPLTVLFRKLYYKYTAKDPGREDFDFSE